MPIWDTGLTVQVKTSRCLFHKEEAFTYPMTLCCEALKSSTLSPALSLAYPYGGLTVSQK